MRPSAFKKGGGFLNEVDAIITDYSWVVGDPAIIKKGERKGETFTPLSLVPVFRVDGADEDQDVRLLVGDAENFGEVSDDGKTLLCPEGQAFFATCEAAIFLDSLCNPEEGDGFPEDRFPEDPKVNNYEAMIGTRVRLVRPVNAEKTERQGKQQGKNGKQYDRRDLKVAQVYSLPVVGKGKAKGSSPVNGKTAAAPSKGGKSKVKEVENDLAETAQAALVRYLSAANENVIAKGKVRMKILTDKEFSGDTDLRNLVEAWLKDDDNLATLVEKEVIIYDPTDKSQAIELVVG